MPGRGKAKTMITLLIGLVTWLCAVGKVKTRGLPYSAPVLPDLEVGSALFVHD